MSRRRAEAAAGVSLFPFLAVLVCLIGALILLLILISRSSRANAREQAERTKAAAARKTEPPPVPAPPARTHRPTRDPEWAAKRARDAAEAEKLRAALALSEEAHAASEREAAEVRSMLTMIESHLRQLRDDYASLAVAEKSLDKKLGEKGITRRQLDQQITAFTEAERDKQAALDEAREKAKKAKVFAVVPHDGPNRTRREPVYFECLGDRIVLQPDGLVFTEKDLAGAVGPGNPLAAVLRAVVDMQLERNVGEGAATPYPLFIIRPEGVGAYYAARGALESWEHEFGYELVDADLPLVFPQVDPARTVLAQRVAEEARFRQQQLVKLAPRLFAESGAGRGRGMSGAKRFRVSPTGQIVPDNTVGGDDDDDGGGYAGRPGRRPGGAGMNGPGGDGMNGPGGDGNGFGSGSGNATAGGPGGYGGAAASGPGGRGFGPGTSGQGNGIGQGTGDPNGSTFGKPGGGFPGGGPTLGTAGNGGGFGKGEPGFPAGGAAGRAPGSPGNYDPNFAGYGPGAGPGGTGPGGYGPAGTGPGNSGNGASAGASGSGGAGAGSNGPGGPNSTGNVAGNAGTGTSGTGSGGSSGSGGGASSGGVMSNYVAGAPPAGSQGAGVSDDSPPRFGDANDRPSRQQRESLAKDRGENWALPDQRPGSIGVRREVRVQLSPERMRLAASGKEIRFDQGSVQAMDRLAKEMQTQIRAWGVAGRGMNWRPSLVFEVEPTAEERYLEIDRLLVGSGMEVRTVRPIVMPEAPATATPRSAPPQRR